MKQQLTNPVGTMKTKEVITLLSHILKTIMEPGPETIDYSQYEATKYYDEKLKELLMMLENEIQGWEDFSDDVADYVLTKFAERLYDTILLARMIEPTISYPMVDDKGNRI